MLQQFSERFDWWSGADFGSDEDRIKGSGPLKATVTQIRSQFRWAGGGGWVGTPLSRRGHAVPILMSRASVWLLLPGAEAEATLEG